MTVTDPHTRLAELGLQLPAVTAPLAAYVPAIRTGDHVYVSGQLPMVDGKLLATGKVGREVAPEQAKELARRCALNALAAVNALIDLARVVRVVKVVGFVASADGFTRQPGVVNGASELLGEAYPGRRVVTVEARPGCLFVTSFHTFPGEHTVVKTQSLIEKR